MTLRSLADLEYKRGNSHRARTLFAEVRRYRQQQQDLLGEGCILRDLGKMERALGRYEDARAAFEEARIILRQANSLRVEGEVVWQLGLLESENDRAVAREHFLAAADIYAKLDNERRMQRAIDRAHALDDRD